MSFGAALGGAASGASQGLGRFSNALMQVMGSQRNRQAEETRQAERKEDITYRTMRDRVTDTANAEAAALRARTAEAQIRAADARGFADMLSQGITPTADPSAMGGDGEPPPETGPYAEMFNNFGYNPDADPRNVRGGIQHDRTMTEIGARGDEERQSIAARQAATGAEPGPSFSYEGGRFPQTPEGYEAARGHGEAIQGLPGNQPTGGVPDFHDALVGGALQRMGGEPDPFKLEAVLSELQARKAPPEHLEYLREYFKQGF